MNKETRDKLALFSGLPDHKVLGNHDVGHLLEALLILEE